MVAPLAPKIRSPDLGKWRQISHAPFQGDLEDCFQSTSLHLSFTEFEIPVDIGQRGSIDKDTQGCVVETVISVFDRGKWVADLDVLLLYEPTLAGHAFVKRLEETEPGCKRFPQHHIIRERLTSIDNWEELMNVPEDIGQEHIGVVRASDNWLARVATACVAVQKGFRTFILPSSGVCWACCSRTYRWSKTQGKDDSSVHRQNQRPISLNDDGESEIGKLGMPDSYSLTENSREGAFEILELDFDSDSSDDTVITIKEAYEVFEALPQGSFAKERRNQF
ncbi:hypothetical protein AK830_g1627 [Neonectria ditissima]|uniref:Uncharacterized protein n=1 Tax=Neonectria ditissima TaxID=78410 RepID=A0A0P7BWP7_9HYPO|nr:hypothetical protein AK830_g1627 [Neonectria ditissima]